ncbi:hypothetical protein OG21DRAFT_1508069 [Imleria badia]|nr:hypothetical protein OG21DRAFT_1508069 [Imleria badia]
MESEADEALWPVVCAQWPLGDKKGKGKRWKFDGTLGCGQLHPSTTINNFVDKPSPGSIWSIADVALRAPFIRLHYRLHHRTLHQMISRFFRFVCLTVQVEPVQTLYSPPRPLPLRGKNHPLTIPQPLGPLQPQLRYVRLMFYSLKQYVGPPSSSDPGPRSLPAHRIGTTYLISYLQTVPQTEVWFHAGSLRQSTQLVSVPLALARGRPPS